MQKQCRKPCFLAGVGTDRGELLKLLEVRETVIQFIFHSFIQQCGNKCETWLSMQHFKSTFSNVYEFHNQLGFKTLQLFAFFGATGDSQTDTQICINQGIKGIKEQYRSKYSPMLPPCRADTFQVTLKVTQEEWKVLMNRRERKTEIYTKRKKEMRRR